MLLTPRAGMTGEVVLEHLVELESSLFMLQSRVTHGGPGAASDYLHWATEAEELLHEYLQQADVEWLVPYRPREQLMAAPQAAQLTLFQGELRQRHVALRRGIETLRAEITRWCNAEGELLVLDTNVFLHAPNKFAEIDLIALINQTGPSSPLHKGWRLYVIIPMIVLDELDNLKLHNNQTTRWRARHALHVLDEAFGGDMKGQLGEGLMVEAVVDPPGHLRLPIADDEIVDRAAAIAAISGRPVSLLTFDTGMATRARMAGLRTRKAPQPPDGEEPQPAANASGSTRANRKDRQRASTAGSTGASLPEIGLASSPTDAGTKSP